MSDNIVFLTGPRKLCVFLRVAIDVAVRYLPWVFRGRMTLMGYFRFLRRALIFLLALRHNKVVKFGRRYKLHLYIPAWPTRAFYHALEKVTRSEPGPVTVVFSMTRACAYHCRHCYQRNDRGADLDMDVLLRVARQMQEIGVSMFDIEGGEPLMRMDRLVELARSLDDRAEIWVNTTGAGLTHEKIQALLDAKVFGVMVSLHSPMPQEHNDFTSSNEAFAAACEALRECGRAGLMTAVNCCPDAAMIRDGRLEQLLDLARQLRCAYVQIIHRKPAGAWLGKLDEIISDPAVLETLRSMHLEYNRARQFHKHPSVSAQVFEEDARLYGCTAGGVDRMYIGADGEVQPCEFLNVSFGNVKEEDFLTIYRRMRSHFQTPGNDWLCCTQAQCIHDAIARYGLTRTPVPWNITKTFIGDWAKGPPTRLYERLGIYHETIPSKG